MNKTHVPNDDEVDDNGSFEELLHQLKRLNQDWVSNSKFPKPFSDVDNEVFKKSSSSFDILHQYFDFNSPRTLVTSLQQKKQQLKSPTLEDGQEEEWKVRTNDLAVLEILRERKKAIETGRLKGRNLLDALDSASSEHHKIFCSGCSSSVLIQGSEVRSSSFCSSSYGGGGGEKVRTDEVVVGGGWKVKERDAVCGDGGGGWKNGDKEMVFMGWFAIVLMAFALGIITWKSFDSYGVEDYQDFLYPT